MDEFQEVSDDELIESLNRLCRAERVNLVAILKHLAKMDDRRIAGRRGYASLFDYCVRVLRYAEGETARRIQAARAAADDPLLLDAVGAGRLSLTGISLLSPHLQPENHQTLIRKAWGRSTREIEGLVASLSAVLEPRERTRILRPLPPPPREEIPSAGELPLSPPERVSRPAEAEAPLRVHFSFTGAPGLLDSVDKAKELLRSRYPSPGLEEVFTEAVARLLESLDPSRRRRRPVPATVGSVRRVPSAVKAEVWVRDGGRCTYVAEGRRCPATGTLQYDHIKPWTLGGRSDDPGNIRLLCRAHNAIEARRMFGDAVVDAAIASRPSS